MRRETHSKEVRSRIIISASPAGNPSLSAWGGSAFCRARDVPVCDRRLRPYEMLDAGGRRGMRTFRCASCTKISGGMAGCHRRI